MQYLQNYNPLSNAFLSTLIAALPILTMLYFLALHPNRDSKGTLQKGVEAWKAALIAAVVAFLAAVVVFRMPVSAAGMALAFGAFNGIFPIGWIIISAMFLYTLTLVTGQFEIVKDSVASISSDRRIQAILIAFCFSAFIEGASGFGTPVAIAGALMVGLGFKPLQAAILCLIANTAPVAYGALGTPITSLAGVTGIDAMLLSKVSALQLPIFALIVPVWMTAVQVKMDGGKWSDVWDVMPALLVAGLSFAAAQFVTGFYMSHLLVAVVGGLFSMLCIAVFSKFWQPKRAYLGQTAAQPKAKIAGAATYTTAQVVRAWAPWALLTVIVLLWGLPSVKTYLNALPGALIKWSIPALDGVVFRMPPVVLKQAKDAAVYSINWLSAPGTGIMIAALLSGLIIGATGKQWGLAVSRTATRLKMPLLTIMLVLAMGYLTRYSGMDAVLGLAFTKTGVMYPFFASLLGWLGVALSGSNTSSNVMFGSMQKITAEQLGLNPTLIAASGGTGGTLGKMINTQSIVVATAACYEDKEEGKLAAGPLFRAVLPHSLMLVCIMGLLVMLQAYAFASVMPR
ncbi:MAG TPA: L-lactate permease [Symbiobacteriaceae bacterium]|nr:L-lactate permease [Symbiobacteriaceae bacterium]